MCFRLSLFVVVWYFTPRSGSIGGGTMITIVGQGKIYK